MQKQLDGCIVWNAHNRVFGMSAKTKSIDVCQSKILTDKVYCLVCLQ